MTSQSRIAALLQPRSVAIVGASADPSKITGRPLAYMISLGYQGQLYPVNPGRETVQGLRSYPSIQAIGQPVDLAIIGTAAARVCDEVAAGADAGVRAFVVFSSGFAETGDEGARRQLRLRELATQRGLAILGPNCLGAASSRNALVASFTTAFDDNILLAGRFALVSQSGALGAYWLDMVLRAGLGFSHWITTGNECDIDAAEAIDYLVDDPDTAVIGTYLEGVRDTVAFRRALQRAASAGKPVLAIKAGSSRSGSVAAASHTGALAGDDAVYDACLRQFGAQRVDSLTSMIDRARLFLSDSVPRGRRLAVMSVSGGAGVLIADAAEAAGLQVPAYHPATVAQLAPLLPVFSKPANPLDLTGQIVQDSSGLTQALAAVTRDPDTDCVVLFVGLMHSIADAFTEALAAAKRQGGKPIAVIWIGARPATVALLERNGLAVFADIPQAISALAGSVRFEERRGAASRAQLPSAPASLSPLPPDAAAPPSPTPAGAAPASLAEWQAKQRLQTQHFVALPPGCLVPPDAPQPAVDTAIALGFPLAAKLQANTLLHKSDAGGVVLAIRDEPQLRAALDRLRHLAIDQGIEADGVLVERMVDFDVELLVGLRRVPRFGPVLTVGRGGVEVELDPDVATRLLPLDAAAIETMLGELRAHRLLEGFRGSSAIDIPALADRIAGLCAWFETQADLVELEINPLVVRHGEAWALDALMRLAPEPAASGAA